MSILLKIAWHNLFRHSKKTVMIGVIILVAAFFLSIGNGLIHGMRTQSEKNIADRMLGDIVLINADRISENIIFDNSFESIKPINNISVLKDFLLSQPEVRSIFPMNTGMCIISEGDKQSYVLCYGVHFPEYYDYYGNVVPEILEGHWISNQSRGILLPDIMREDLYSWLDHWYHAVNESPNETYFTEEVKKNKNELKSASNIILIGFGQETYIDERFEIHGIFRYSDYQFIMNNFVLMDTISFRNLFNFISENEPELDEEQENLLGLEGGDFESMFEETEFSAGEDSSVIDESMERLKFEETEIPEVKKLTPLKDDNGAFNLVNVHLNDGVSSDKYIKILNRRFSQHSELSNVKAVSWKVAVGQIYEGTNLVASVILGFNLFLFFIIIIIVTNALNMAAIERSSEIAMMRSVGTRKSWIAWMFLFESMLIAVIFGMTGIILGMTGCHIINALQITNTSSEMFTVMFAGDQVTARFGLVQFLLTVCELLIFSVLGVVYPIRIAAGVKPIQAVSRE